MASLDFSYVDVQSPSAPAKPADLTALVDQSSLGVVKDGIYEVKDWEFASTSDLSASVLTQALTQERAKQAAGSSFGVLGNMFARLTGSKVLAEEDLKPVLDSMKQHLMKKNVAKEIADKVCEGVSNSLVGKKLGNFQCAH
jgi:signal recognition particle receptor subunit alpha